METRVEVDISGLNEDDTHEAIYVATVDSEWFEAKALSGIEWEEI